MLPIKLDQGVFLPTRAHPLDAGLDLRASKDYFLIPHARELISTGVCVKIPTGYVGLLVARSSLSKKGVYLTNAVGVIDSEYTGEILISVTYDPRWTEKEEDTQYIEKNERIAQLVIVPCLLMDCVQVDYLTETDRGNRGFGSTGK